MNKVKKSCNFTTVKFFINIIKENKPCYFLLCILYIILNAIYPFIGIYFSQYIIDELIGGRDIKKLLILVLLMLVLGEGIKWVSEAINLTRAKLDDEFTNILKLKIAKKSMEMKFEYTENPKVLESLERAKSGLDLCDGGIGGLSECIINLVINTVELSGVLVILMIGIPELTFVFVFFLIIDTYLTNKLKQIEFNAFTQIAYHNRIFQYYYYKLCDYRYGKDIRLYQAESLLKNKTEYFNDQMLSTWKKQSFSNLPYELASTILTILRTGITILVIGIKVIEKNITLGELTKYYTSSTGMQNSIKMIISSIQELSMKCRYVEECIQYLNYDENEKQGNKVIGNHKKHCIVFRNVTFTYSGNNEPALYNLNLTIQSGEHISIVGLNGAGKTTFIKLLCRLYKPTEGTIYLDNINIEEYNYEDYIQLISVVFQDFQLFSFTAYENIVFSSKNRIDEKERKKLNEIIEKAGLSDTFRRLPKGLDTHIFKDFEEEGIELSGGQQQKLAIARALYKNAPIIILDEPTAALDAITEFDIYNKFKEIAKDKTAIFISHRLSSCHICDIIYVFKNGLIKEQGTHKELIDKGGLYYTMYEAQSVYYRS